MGRYAEGSDARAIDAAVQSIFGRGYEFSPLEGGADVWAALMEFVNVIFTMFGLLALALAGLDHVQHLPHQRGRTPARYRHAAGGWRKTQDRDAHHPV